MTLKRYLVFSGEDYYPAGGWEDFDASYDTLAEAHAAIKTEAFTWAHVVDRDTGHIILEFDDGSEAQFDHLKLRDAV